MTLRHALRLACPLEISEASVTDCLDLTRPADALFARARAYGLSALPLAERRSLNPTTGEIAEAVVEVVLADAGLHVFWHITTPGVRGVDLLFLCPDESVLALEVKGTLRPNTIPRLTPSKRRQMSRDWLNGPGNPAMAEWELEADDLYAGVMTVDLACSVARIGLSADFESFTPVDSLAVLQQISSLF